MTDKVLKKLESSTEVIKNNINKKLDPRTTSTYVYNKTFLKHMQPSKNKKNTDKINHPHYYTQGGIECIEAMISAYGKEAVMNFCKCNAFKYLWRAGIKKEGASLEQDIKKAQWYQNKLIELSK